MKKLRIGLFGAVINSTNLGCLALTYSLISLLEKIAQEKNFVFYYDVFEGTENYGGLDTIRNELNIEAERINKFAVSYVFKNRTILRHPKKSMQIFRALKRCDLAIDLTAGDSFTDIYGDERFLSTSKIKKYFERKNIPLILGPQTYGPFQKKENAAIAKAIVERANCVITRDQMSADYLSDFVNKEINVTTDLAFSLPYKKTQQATGDKIKVGVNISSLLVKNKTEDTKVNFKLSVDYDQFISKILEKLCEDSHYEVYLIPHVGADAVELFHKRFENTNLVETFNSPIEAKSFISGMDIFIGARMHATIASFSSGVATIPTAYSRKFKGLFENLEYPYIVDLASLSTKVAIDKTLEFINDYKKLQFQIVNKSANLATEKSAKTKEVLMDAIIKIADKI